MTGTANDDKGVNSLTYWFRDEQQRYLQDDGSVDDIFNTFRGEPDVVGATNATWSYDVTLPHEGVWRGSATAVDTTGQADLRSATRDWTVDSTGGRSDRHDRTAGGDDPAVRRADGDDRAGRPGDLLRLV